LKFLIKRLSLILLDSLRQSQIEAKRPYDRGQPQVGLSEEEDRFGKVAACPNSKSWTDSGIYRNNLKNREFGKEGPQNLDSERATIAERQGASENRNYEANPTQPKPDSSSYFGIT